MAEVPYSQRAEWADVQPVPVTDDAGKVVAIQYDTRHKETLGYFRACLAKVRVHSSVCGKGLGKVCSAYLLTWLGLLTGVVIAVCRREVMPASCNGASLNPRRPKLHADLGWMHVQGEKSERVLELTADMISSNSADYTAWKYRWDTLTALKSDLQRECTFTE